MKRLLALALFLVSARLYGQAVPVAAILSDIAIRLDGGPLNVPGYGTFQVNGVAQTPESTANFVAGSNMTITGSLVGGVTTLTFASTGGAAGALLSATDAVNTAPVRGGMVVANSTPKWAQVSLGAANTVWTSNGTDPSWLGPITPAMGGTGLATITAHAVMVGEGTSNVAPVGPGNSGEVLVSGGGSADPSYTGVCAAGPNQICIFDDFINGSSVTGAAASGTFFRCSASGTGAGCNSTITTSGANNGPPPDANTVGIWEVTTGTTTTGIGLITSAGATGGSASQASMVFSAGDFLESRIWVPVASNVTDTFQAGIAFCDTIGTCANGALLYWDNNTDTHWVAKTVNTGTGAGNTTSTSTTVATAAAWHKLKITYDGTNMRFFVDGSELNVSPITTHITVGNMMIQPVFVLKSAGTAAKVADIDYTWYKRSVTR